MANHNHFLDPIFVMAAIDNPMKLSNSIEKQKAVPDLKTVRNIFNALKNGGAVGLFPERSVT
ncbi:MAG: hypothetical protein U9O65_00815 [Thermotogota bacterium]|nr:hypothetical protein [Thermotogota bacterium]